MPLPPDLASQAPIAGPLGSLALSVVSPRAPTLALRAIRWHADLERLGVAVPLFLVHDVGLVLAAPTDQLELGPRVDVSALLRARSGGRESLHAPYGAIIGEIAQSEAARRAQALRMGDDLVVVVLARLLRTIAERISEPPAYVTALPLDTRLFERVEGDLPALYGQLPRAFELAALGAISARRLHLLTLVDALDLDTLSLFGFVGGDATSGALTQVDLLALLGAPEANDVVDFSLEILPSVLETKARPGASTHAAFGYAGLSRKGSIDNLVLTELAWDELELMRRLMDDEVLYYAKEQARDEARRVHYLLIDASASMRGERATFARGTAIAAAKQLSLSGEDVVFRFFDARLYEPQPARGGRLPIAHVLSFKGERGRNPTRVFHALVMELEIARLRDPRQPIVHLYTHGALYIPRETAAALAELAHVAAVFMLPSGGALELDYLDLLAAYFVVDHGALASRKARASEARRILDALDARTQAWRGGGTGAESSPPASRGGARGVPPRPRA